MSLTIDNKTFRNLEEQVLKNKEDIAKHYEVDRVLADWGIKVIGVVATINDIPEGNYQYGDSYGLSSTSPMQYVVWTRANPNVGQDTDYWLNVGALSLVGPQGAQGIQGIQGIQGVRGSKWISATSAPTATSGYNMNDQWLNTSNGDVYEFRGNTWARIGNIRGAQGVQGPMGPRGEQGIQGPTGPQGVKGDTGSSFTIAGLLNSADNLPTPTEANRHKGYAVKNVDNVTYDLYVVVGEAGSLQWVNMGRVEGVEGPQGPVGPQGPAGADIQIVHITGIPSTATQGNLTQDQVNTLLAHPGNYIQFFNENFYPQDVEIGEGYIVYSHVGQIGNETKIKNINLTLATGGWVLTETKLVNETQLNAKQDTLVSGTNIKTINGESILGSGNITIEGGGSGGGEVILDFRNIDNIPTIPRSENNTTTKIQAFIPSNNLIDNANTILVQLYFEHISGAYLETFKLEVIDISNDLADYGIPVLYIINPITYTFFKLDVLHKYAITFTQIGYSTNEQIGVGYAIEGYMETITVS